MKHLACLVALGTAFLFNSSTSASAQNLGMDAAIKEKLNLNAFSTQELDIPELTDGELAFEIDIDGQPLTMLLQRFSLRAPDFKLLVSDGSGLPREVEAPLPSTVRGEILELEGSFVTGGMIRGQLHAQIFYEGQHWGLQPLSVAIPTAASNSYVVYNATSVGPVSGVCGVNASQVTPSTTGTTAALGTGQPICEIALECDQSYYNGNGASLQSTINDAELIMNRVDNIYDTDVDTRFIITTIHIWTANTPYSGSLGDRLSQFRSYWNSNFGFIKKDLAHYMVGGSSGGVIGVAYLSGVCNSARYGVSRTKFSNNLTSRTALTAHEIGHNYSSGHCSGSSCKIMCASIGGCGGPLTHFGTSAANNIRNYSFARPCTSQNGSHLTAPWTDTFESTSIDTSIWPANQDATTSTAAMAEVSGDRSLNLDGGNGSPEGQDRIISNYTLLSGQADLFVTYHTQHVGVSNSGSLLVEYRQESGAWEAMNTVTSDGNDQSAFTFHSHSLPGNAYHDEFQLRFISQGGAGTSSDWYVEDVSVGDDAGCAGSISNYCLASANSVGAGMTLTATGSSSFIANDLSFLGVGGPSGNFGVLFMGLNQSASLFGDGVLCVAGGIIRYAPIQIGALTTVDLVVDNTAIPAVTSILPGTTWNFQFWYRDPAAGGSGFNTTDAAQVNFCD
ncbi:MAG: hypothetical protein ACI8X5_003881 [Planctomycetota bacterium]|jgi:hypothetical protein